MNAGGMFKACKSKVLFGVPGKRESNTLVTYLEHRDNLEKSRIIPDGNGGT